MADLGAIVRDALHGVDARTLPVLYRAVSVPPQAVRAWLRARSLPFLDPEAPAPKLAEVDRTADHVIAQGQATSAAVAALGGIAGWVAAPTEAVAWIVASVRLAQRLAIVYGFDPGTERGRTAIVRALAAGIGAELPEGALTDIRVSDLVRRASMRAITPGAPPLAVGTVLARAVVRRSVSLATRRLGRLVPVVSSGIGASENRRVTAEVGRRMKAVYRRLAEVGASPDAVVDAIEIVPDR